MWPPNIVHCTNKIVDVSNHICRHCESPDLRRCSINSTNNMHGIHLNVMAVTALMVAQAASTAGHCELCFTCIIYKGYLHGNLYYNMDYEFVIP